MQKSTKYSHLQIPMRSQVFESRRQEIIEHYLNVASCSIPATIQHFKDKYKRLFIYSVVRRYKEQGTVKARKSQARKSNWKPSKWENYRKFQELYKMDPLLSTTEAAQLLGMNRCAVNRFRKKLLANLNSSPNGEEAPGHNAFNAITTAGDRISNNGEAEMNHHHGDDDQDFFGDASEDVYENDDMKQEEKSLKPRLKRLKFKTKANTKMPTEDMPKKICLICSGSIRIRSDCSGRHSQKKALQENLTIIFVLKKILGLSSEDLVEVMRKSKGNDPKDWTGFCGKCNELVKKVMDFQGKIRKLEEQMAQCKQEIIENVRKSSHVRLNKRKQFLNARVRDIVGKLEDPSSLCQSQNKNPFEEGDKEAESRALERCPVQVGCVELGAKVKVEEEFLMEQEVDMPESDEVELGLDGGTSPENMKTDSNSGANVNTQRGTKFDAFWNRIVESKLDANVHASMPSETEVVGGPRTTTATIPTLGVCDICGLEIRPLALPNHKLKEHGVVMEGYSLKKCSVEGCKYETLYDSGFKEHMKRHNLSWAHACQFCGKVFKHKMHLRRHEDIHKNKGSRPYQCEICGASFAVSNYLYLHTRLSHQGRPFPSTNRKRDKPNQLNISI